MAEHYKKHGCKGCFIKLDIKKYFPSIDHSVLYGKLEKFGFAKYLFIAGRKSFDDMAASSLERAPTHL